MRARIGISKGLVEGYETRLSEMSAEKVGAEKLLEVERGRESGNWRKTMLGLPASLTPQR